jgi:hypothetical protein
LQKSSKSLDGGTEGEGGEGGGKGAEGEGEEEKEEEKQLTYQDLSSNRQ